MGYHSIHLDSHALNRHVSREQFPPQKHLRRKLFTTDMPIQSVTIKMDGVVPLNGAMEWPKDVLDMLHTMLVDQKVRIRLAPGSTCLPVFASIDFGETNVQQFLVDNEFAPLS